MIFCVGFLFQFLIAGLTGIMLGAAPFDWQLTNSYFVVAHFHYVIVGGFCLPYSRPSIIGTRRSRGA
jgi:cytochrome c oxidase subunit I